MADRQKEGHLLYSCHLRQFWVSPWIAPNWLFQKSQSVSLRDRQQSHYANLLLLPLHFVIASEIGVWLKHSNSSSCLCVIAHKHCNLVSLIDLNVLENDLIWHNLNRWTSRQLLDACHCAIQTLDALIHLFNKWFSQKECSKLHSINYPMWWVKSIVKYTKPHTIWPNTLRRMSMCVWSNTTRKYNSESKSFKSINNTSCLRVWVHNYNWQSSSNRYKSQRRIAPIIRRNCLLQ